MKCPNCHEQLGAVVPIISLEAAEADAKRYRDLHEISDECVTSLKEQMALTDAEVRTLEMRLMASRTARKQAEHRVVDARRLAEVHAINWLAANGHDVAGRALLAHLARELDKRDASTMGGGE